ncbi:DUF1853 family protein [Lutimonas halocynthiae]|uniref:DUF1853 family protein n=1 Tax=Lutimonas halocynthiae TaxID=1446477 RepID=UPI0025B34E4B|nr:DUF1853 family protein [Lutimonas halocynthiae]MDN3644018.1 DUF1853 family protein [Lutimonas halocynthiae]
MDLTDKNIQLQYQGYVNTPLLWQLNSLYGLKQFEFSESSKQIFPDSIPERMRLGNRVEKFVYHDLRHNLNIEMLLENQQIQDGKLTIGELDCVLKQDHLPIHLEIVYKFYLYDPEVGSSELEHWIGPNRNDTLLKKLNKLKHKQLPLLHNRHTKEVLNKVNLLADEINQRVYFKAQLFVPYQAHVEFDQLNEQCLKGVYIHASEIEQLSGCEFFIPTKVDWLQEARPEVDWMPFINFKELIKPILHEKRAPLCWIKFPDGKLQKFFVVWWS